MPLHPATARIPVQYQPPRYAPSIYASSTYVPPTYPPSIYPPSTYAPAPYASPPRVYPPPFAYPPPVLVPPPGWGSPSAYPHSRRRGRLLPAAAVVVAILAVLGIGGGAATVAVGAPPGSARMLGGDAGPAAARDEAFTALLTRRSDAVRARDQAAFLADVDRADPAFVTAQEKVYQNLTKLPFIDFAYRVHSAIDYDATVPAALKQRYGADVRALAVSVSYRVEGVDDGPVAVPWVPIFARVSGRWKLVGDAVDKSLPPGVGGQAWDAGAITVARSSRVVGVFSTGSDNPDRLLRLAEQALDRVAAVRPAGWAGKIFVIAVRDRKVFDAYFADAPERVEKVAAIAVPQYDAVFRWSLPATYAATRIIFNPDELSEDPSQLADDLTHEFTHAAMAPATSGWTPTWLVEGFAEYVAYKGVQISQSALRRVLKTATTNDLVATDKFYEESKNYVTAWLACRMIAERYGEAKLIALYEAFKNTAGEEAVIGRVLGIPRSTLIAQWKDYVAKQRI